MYHDAKQLCGTDC